MHSRLVALALLLGMAALPAAAQEISPEPGAVQAGSYVLDKEHGKITWSVSHFGLSTYIGQFTDIDGRLTLDPARIGDARLEATIRTGSVATLHPALDEHLRSADFLNVAKFPSAAFVSRSVERTGKRTARITGDLTLLEATKPVVMEVAFNAAGVHPVDKKYTVGFTGRTVIRRSEWGMTTYVPGIGDEVTLEIEGEFKPAS